MLKNKFTGAGLNPQARAPHAMKFPWTIVVSLVSVIAMAPCGQAADWPQWRGPQRTGVSRETGWSSRWPASGPKRLWTAQVGAGHSSVAVVGGRVYTMGNVGNQDVVWCLQAATGKVIWKYAYPCPAGNYAGTRATPTVQDKCVYTLSRDGLALCLDAVTGRKLWKRNLVRLSGAPVPKWGVAGSPLVEGNLVIYNVGAAGIALDKATGILAWKSAAGLGGYASPVAYTSRRQRGVALFAASGLVGLNPANGQRLWHYPWSWNDPYQVNAADPIFWGDTVFISSAYNRGCALLKIGGATPSLVYRNTNMRNHINTCVLWNGFLYGSDQNTLKCLEIRSGKERWQSGRIGKGGLIIAAGKLIVLTERGVLLLAEARPDRYVEIARAKVLGGTCYAHPVLADGRIFCRNRDGELVCLDVRQARRH